MSVGLVRASVLAGVAPHAFTTREGGVSPAPWDSLNLGHGVGDARERVEANLRLALEAAGLGAATLHTAHQVHGATAVAVSERAPLRREGLEWRRPARGGIPTLVGDADAVITDDPVVAVGVRVADCTPILLASDDGRVVAAVHAGWRGTAAGILGEVIDHLCGAFGVDPCALRVAIGPAIGGADYEVGPEVAAPVRAVAGIGEEGRPGVVWPGSGDRWQVDLAQVNRLLALARGVPAQRCQVLGISTASDARFFSHRRDAGRTGRHLALIAPGGRHG